jgi:CubicO group peptidase (beta-lactamase class C family)
MGDTFTPLFAEDPNRYRSNADFLPLFVDVPLASEPGVSFSYSNAGFVVLGLIIEQVTGRDYYDYVRDAIFTPAGMVDTDSYALEDEVPNLAMGYTTLDIDGRPTGVLSENAPLMPGRGFAAGGGYSTTEDLLRFRNALLGHRLLTPGFTEQLIAGQGAMAPGWEYGYGFMIRIDDGSVGHTGGAPGICSFMSMYPESGYTVVVLSNSDADCREILAYVHANPPATPSAGPGPRSP